MPLFGVKNKLTVNRLPLIRQGKALPPSPQGEGLRQRSLPQGEAQDSEACPKGKAYETGEACPKVKARIMWHNEMRKANKTFKTLYFRGGM